MDGAKYSFPKEEEAILALWDRLDAFKEQLRRTEGLPEFVFYDGPPFATGLPHYGHILAGTIKDVVTRYATAKGHHVVRRFGWDCHGLPVEHEIDKKLKIKGRDDVLAMGIGNYNEECRSIVMRYSKEWEVTVKRVGRWIDFENDYKTMQPTFMESVWWVWKQLYEKGLVYRGFKVMPYSTTCNTPLSNFEAGLDYRDVSDPAVMVSFPLKGDADGAAMVAWTTTPWTLPSNLALCVHPEFVYVKVKDNATGKVYIVAKARLEALPFAAAKKGKKGKDKDAAPAYEVLAELQGTELAGKEYEPLFGYFAHITSAFRVVNDTYVTDDSGTGVVHQAPAYGEDDNRVCIANGIVVKGGELPDPVDANGCFQDPVKDFAGLHVKEADKSIIAAIKEKGRMVNAATLVHSYPFCWRSGTPLIYKAVPSYFVNVTALKPQLLANNAQTYWVPGYVKEKRFQNWLEAAHDWAVSRNRYWGTPIPCWRSDDGEEEIVIGSIAELEELTGKKFTDIHRHFLDDVTIPSRQGKGVLRRVEDVFDCWFESGSMPYAQQHYPFEDKAKFEANFPADFIAEGLDQTRGWFYTLMVLSTALFDRPPFKNLVCNGLVLAADGKKMSKSLRNYPPPEEIVNEYGADALRLYLVNSPVVRAEPLRFQKDGVFRVVKDLFLPWYNAYRFLVQNVLALQEETGRPFDPKACDPKASANVLDRWVWAATNDLVQYVRTEMEAYRLYTVAPRLVEFIDQLTNIYVRLNRARLKGKNGQEDQTFGLCTLFSVLLVTCKVMAPFTPFFVENMYQNLQKAMPSEPASVHWCRMPEADPTAFDAGIQRSVERMWSVVEQGRLIRERKTRPLKLPLRKLIVVHSDEKFLSEIAGTLKGYVQEELNVVEVETCAEPEKYTSVRAEPNFATLGKRLGKAMGAVGKFVKGMDAAAIAAFEAAGSIEVEGHTLGAEDVKIVRDFKMPEGMTADDIDASNEGGVLVLLELKVDEELMAAGAAREVGSRVQRLRKKAGLQPGEPVEVFYETADAALAGAIERCGPQLAETLGSAPLPMASLPQAAVRLLSEEQTMSDGTALKVTLALPAVVAAEAALLAACGGDATLAAAAETYLASRDPEALRAAGGARATIDGKPVVLTLGEHFHLSASAALSAKP